MNYAVVVPWHNKKQRDEFVGAWGLNTIPDWVILQQDDGSKSCAITKNNGIKAALARDVEYVIVLDDDCYPIEPQAKLQDFADAHIKCLQPTEVRLVIPTTIPSPRGMPYRRTGVVMPVAASMGFWLKNPDFDAIQTLVNGAEQQVSYMQTSIYGRYFPFSGMNYAFHKSWADCAIHINVPRFDDIWMGWVWQKMAFLRGACFNLNGPLVNHVRQSNVWKNFEEEVKYLQANEHLWETIHFSSASNPEELREIMTKPLDTKCVYDRPA